MYLPRKPTDHAHGSSSSASQAGEAGSGINGMSSSHPEQRTRTHHAGLHPNTWAPATTAPASVQVHYHYLAGRYRDLSTEHGLGLAKLTRVDEDAAPSSDASQADVSVRASQKAALGGIFLGAGQDTAKSGLESWRPSHNQMGKLHVPLGKKSKRETALQRMKQDDLLRRRIEGTKDVGRLKWEAKVSARYSCLGHWAARLTSGENLQSALLSHSHPLAVILLARAATLSSLSSCISLAALLTTGATRGTAPVVVLLERDPLRALSWCLDAAALLQQRSAARHRRGRNSPSEEEQMRQQIASHLSRLVRTTQADPMRQRGAEVMLPVARSAPALELWNALSGLLGWLSGPTSTPSSESAPSGPRGPDDEDEAGQRAAALRKMAVDLSLIRAIAITRATLAPGQSGWAQAARREWDEVREAADAAGRMDLAAVLAAAQTVCLELEKGKKAALIGPASALAEAFEESLVERHVRVVVGPASKSDVTTPRPQSSAQPQVKNAPPEQRVRRGSLDQLVASSSKAGTRPPSLLFPVGGSSAPAQTTHTPAQASKPDMRDVPARRQVVRTVSLQPEASSNPAVADAAAQAASSLAPSRQSALRARRPSSVCSDSPSLLFPVHDSVDEDPATSEATTQPVSPCGSQSRPATLWAAKNEDATISSPSSRAAASRRRVTSLYGEPSVVSASGMSVSGSTSSDYGYEPNGVFDPTASLRSAQRRRRVDSSATSASTALSVLSTAPSIAESMAWERERESPQAYAHFSLPSSDSASARLDIVGRASDAQAPDAIDSLRSLSGARAVATPSADQALLGSGDGPAARTLTSRLERTMHASSSVSRASGAGLAHHRFPSSASGTFGLDPRQRTNSNASLASLTSFVSTTNRQGRNGTLKSPISPTFPKSLAAVTSTANRDSVASSATTSAADRSGSSNSAVGSLRRFGGTDGRQRPALPAASATSSAEPTNTVTFPSSTDTHSRSSKDRSESTTLRNGAKKTSLAPLATGETPAVRKSDTLSPPGSASRRSFFGVDPTSGGTYGQDHAGVSGSNAIIRSEGDSPTLLSPRPMDEIHSQETAVPAPSSRTASINTNSDLDAALASAEDKSRLKTASACTMCGAQVVNAPISRSGHVFCGRQCRMDHKAAGKRK